MTLYRTGANSQIVRALIQAAENGKQVAVSIELKARFDEENNIVWARALERAGVHVFYGPAGLKTHAKVTLVVRREKDEARSLRSSLDGQLQRVDGEDLHRLRSLHGRSRNRRGRLGALQFAVRIFEEVALPAARRRPRTSPGNGAREDRRADRARARGKALRDLRQAQLARGSARSFGRSTAPPRRAFRSTSTCGASAAFGRAFPATSENIRVFSVVGRFLEHERVFVFGPAPSQEFYLSSADWMPRNFYRRVEMLFPIENESIREKLAPGSDRARARRTIAAPAISTPQGVYRRRRPAEGDAERDSQAMVLDRLRRHGLRAVGQGVTGAVHTIFTWVSRETRPSGL